MVSVSQVCVFSCDGSRVCGQQMDFEGLRECAMGASIKGSHVM